MTVQNLVVLDAVISILCIFILHVKLEMHIHALKIWSFGDFIPKMGSSMNETPRRHILGSETRRMTYRSSKSVHLCGLRAS